MPRKYEVDGGEFTLKEIILANEDYTWEEMAVLIDVLDSLEVGQPMLNKFALAVLHQ